MTIKNKKRAGAPFNRIYCSGILLLFAALASAQGWSARFLILPPTDTLHVEVRLETDTVSFGDTISNQLFFSAIPAVFLQEIDHVADSSEALVLGRYHFALNDSVEAYWVEIRQFWFQHHSLFLYNKHKQAFTDRVTLAEWYGGDGGQILTGSWLFDYDGDGRKDILRQEIQHSMIADGDSAVENIQASVALLLQQNSHFVETPLKDEAETIRLFPIKTFW